MPPTDHDAAAGTAPSATPYAVLALGSLAVAFVASLFGFLVTMAVNAVSADAEGVQLLGSMVAVGAALGIGSYFLGQRFGAPTTAHLLLASAGGLVLALLSLVGTLALVLKIILAIAYAGITVAGVRAGARSRLPD